MLPHRKESIDSFVEEPLDSRSSSSSRSSYESTELTVVPPRAKVPKTFTYEEPKF